MKMKQFSRVSIAKSEGKISKNFKNFNIWFQVCNHRYRRLIKNSKLISHFYSQIWLNLPRDYIYIFLQLLMYDHHLIYIWKFLVYHPSTKTTLYLEMLKFSKYKFSQRLIFFGKEKERIFWDGTGIFHFARNGIFKIIILLFGRHVLKLPLLLG